MSIQNSDRENNTVNQNITNTSENNNQQRNQNHPRNSNNSGQQIKTHNHNPQQNRSNNNSSNNNNNNLEGRKEQRKRLKLRDSSRSIMRNNNTDHNAPEMSKEERILSRPEGLKLQEMYYAHEIKKIKVDDLYEFALKLNIPNPDTMYKQDLVFIVMNRLYEYGCTIIGYGVLDIVADGYGFLRYSESNYSAGPDDIYVSQGIINKNGLRTGDFIECVMRAPRKGEKYFALDSIININGGPLNQIKMRPHFDDLTPLFAQKQIILENALLKNNISGRLIDIISPIGRGQRALVVAPPRTGKTYLIQNIAHAITTNYPDVYLIVLLIGERPEEVTDMSRSVKGEVVSSTFDEPSQRHVQLAELVIEKAKRLVEAKKDVVIVLDSITRMARAYNDVAPSSGKILSGGVDSNALQKPKRFFGAARNIEEGGSLTIIATALIETGSRMDEVIFEEFKGTGNSELILDRKVSDRRTFPAIDIIKSGTRKEDLLINKDTLSKIWVLRRIISNMSTIEALEFILTKLKMVENNEEFFSQMDTHNPTATKKKTTD